MILRLFGSLSVQVNGQSLPPLSRKAGWLLALLSLERGRERDRACLAGLLWPESEHSQALYNLRRALAELRAGLGEEACRISSPRSHTLALDVTGAEIDVLAFDAALARGDEASLASAVELYRGPLLEECGEEWILGEREARERAYLEALESLAGHALGRGDDAAARRWLHRVVAVDPFRETAQQALLKALIAAGEYVSALLTYREFRLRLRRELRAEPSPETKALFRQLRTQARCRSGSALPISASPPALPHHLPRPLSPFVGRQATVRALTTCLESVRLVTLTGPGGVGKTRLAIRVAEAAADDYADGVCFVDLTRLTDPALVPQVVAAALGAQEQPGRPLPETLAEFLRSRQLLLVLDNCEHLLAAAAELAEALLAGGAGLRVLATSRQSLGLTGEQVWPVSGLSIPPAGEERRAESLLRFEAVCLFVDRAAAAAPSFSLTARTAPAVAEICRRLDGIPLAIELAAARLRALSVGEVAERLDDAFRLLTIGSRRAPPRQHTLRAAMDWSYELLSPPERLLLQRLSVFAARFTLQAAEAVARGESAMDSSSDLAGARAAPVTPEPTPPADLLDALAQLVDQSLVMVEISDEQPPAAAGAGETRYHLLEMVRQYALARLRAADRERLGCEEAALRRRHRDFYLRQAEAARCPPEEADLDHLRAALDWTLEQEPEGEMSLRVAVALARLCKERGHREEARQRLTAVLERAGPWRRTEIGAWALIDLAGLTFLPDYPTARALYEEALSSHRESGNRTGIAVALWGLGHAARRQGDYPEARARHEESLALRRELGDRSGIAASLIGLGDTLRDAGEDPATWAALYEEALAIRRELDDRPGVADALGQLANLAWRRGDYDQARRWREESLALWRDAGSHLGVIHALGALGHLARDQGKFEEARAFYADSLRLRWEMGDLYLIIQALEDFAELAAHESHWARAARLLGTARARREEMGKPLLPREVQEYEALLGRARSVLGETAAAAEWRAGQATSLEQATALALALE